MTDLQLDILCAIKYLTDDRRSKEPTSIDVLGIFFRASDKSKRKTFMHKYDIYGKYPDVLNREIDGIVGWLKTGGFLLKTDSLCLSKKGLDYIKTHRPLALKNPYEFENQSLNDGGKYEYIGKYACYYRLDVFKKKSLNEILDRLEGFNSTVSPYPLTREQVTAWEDSYKVLQDSFKDLPAKYNSLYVVLEYVLPLHNPNSRKSNDDNGIRADVILVSRTATMVVEFKQREDDFEGFVRQAVKYTTRLKKYHTGAKPMRHHTVLVLTKASKYLKRHDGATTCSKDYLSDIIQIAFDADYERNEGIKGWLQSSFKE